ncbi:hypothetical protein [Gordonia aichiensis]|uniref:Uncharacterized protein n=1 Tax=Gordonia aichiensis NBRC 108223 TaxID=1220583 RepID=L7KHG7_9ACTN|nr:hypothetical protein [Gordonia aichiensis]GAC47148.1 hypothetical protein GOACH_03_01660 [Gordonia aichiensis NBRC 108223]
MAQSAVNDAQRSGVRRAEKQGRRRKRKAAERTAAGAVAVAAVATLGFGQTVGAGQAEAGVTDDVVNAIVTGAGDIAAFWNVDVCANGEKRGNANCSDASKLGIAVVLPDEVSVVPSDNNKSHGSAVVRGSGYEFALAAREGKATAIAFLPVSLATAGATDGRTAWSFAVLGMANAWTTDTTDVTLWYGGPGAPLVPGIKSVGCYGGATAAYAEGVGACANVAGTFDFRYNELAANKTKLTTPEVQFALTDPTAVISDPAGVFTDVLRALLNGETPWLSKDFTRLTVGGDRTDAYGLPVLFTLTSDYGTQAPIVVHWLGSSITFNPLVNVNDNGKAKPNHLGIPVITFGDVDTAQLLPTVDIPAIAFPFGLPSVGPFGETGSAARSAGQITALRATSGDAVVPTRAAAASAVDNSTTPASENNTAAQETDDVSVSVPSADSQTAPAQADSHDEDASRPQAQREVSSDPASQAGADSPNTTQVDGGASAYVGKHRSPDDYVGKHRSTDTGGQVGASSQDGTGSQERAGSHSGAESHTGAAGQAGAVSHAETSSSASSANAE